MQSDSDQNGRRRASEKPAPRFSVTIEYVPGLLTQLTQFLAGEGVPLRALAIDRVRDVVAIRFITDRKDGMRQRLLDHGFPVIQNEAL